MGRERMTTDTPPEWIVNKATETSETWGIPFHEALQMEINLAIQRFGMPLPAKDPVKEQKRQKAVEQSRVLDPERFK